MGHGREDYSADGAAWDYLPHDHARSRAYRWGEDGIAGYSDASQRLCFSLALWNGKDPILKERLFGLTNDQGNHGEDVKELYHYLDATPTHSYLSMLYRYPQSAYPYQALVEQNRARGIEQPEFELYDSEALRDGRYFDVTIEYAKVGPTDTLIRIRAHNRGPEAAELHLLPQLWFRNTWSWGKDAARPELLLSECAPRARHETFGDYTLQFEPGAQVLFTENDTNVERLYGVAGSGYYKDGFHEAVVGGRPLALRGDGRGTKAALHYRRTLAAGASTTVELRLVEARHERTVVDARSVFDARRREADAFYWAITSTSTSTATPAAASARRTRRGGRA